ncbi:SRPBCC family protein [Algoriphagus sp. AK58]|uniref:SRPBCC family protein n=1 Tax=Algoriphagus sp. AK58 TaxID=1406877 RepID=UPI00164F8324|nr:SRPBCC family protein [Algoriphagus sp. AK58]MBC6368517.1 activator of HSP90 ATPase [Algoriphagus sp. AK58]
MTHPKITVQALVSAPLATVWERYTQPEHITQWNFAHPSWHCPSASNDLQVGGRYFARMEAKDGSFGFDFEAVYLEIVPMKSYSYEFGGRVCQVEFKEMDGKTEVKVTFDPETENSLELQQNGWQAILDNFKNYAEQG